MRSKKSSALDAIKAAMEAEMDAHNFYSKAAQKTENPKGRDMFSQFADFERNHFLHLLCRAFLSFLPLHNGFDNCPHS